MSNAPQTIYLKDYKPHPYEIENVFLTVTLSPEKTHIVAVSQVKKEKRSRFSA